MSRPSDVLDFLRRQGGGPGRDSGSSGPPPGRRPGRVYRLTSGQLAVGAIATGMALLVVFFVGLSVGGSSGVSEEEAKGPWVLRVVTYPDTLKGRRRAQQVAQMLKDRGFPRVRLYALQDTSKITVTVGGWARSPRGARNLENRVRDLDWGGDKPFRKPLFWKATH